MNRRGQTIMGMSLETLGKLVLYGFMLIMTVWAIYAMVNLFVSGEKHYRARQNFELFTDRIDATLKDNLQPPENTVIIHLPENYFFVGFDANQQELKFRSNSDVLDTANVANRFEDQTIKRPSQCKDQSCICLIAGEAKPDPAHQITQLLFIPTVVECKRYAGVKTIAGTFKRAEVILTGVNLNVNPSERSSMGTYDFIFSNPESGAIQDKTDPVNLQIRREGEGLLITARWDSPACTNPKVLEGDVATCNGDAKCEADVRSVFAEKCRTQP